MSDQDPFELLSALRGSDADEYLPPGEDASADASLERIVNGESGARPRRRGRRRRRVIAAVVAVGLVGSGAVAAAVWRDKPSDPTTLSCYSEASAEPAIQVGLTIDPDSTPVDQCAVLWRDGTLGSGGPPPVTECVTAAGITAVIPGDEGACGAIGMAARDPVLEPDEALAARIVSEISSRWPTDCVDSVDAAVVFVETIFADLGADGWEVRPVAAITAERPCAYAGGVDAAQEIVVVATAAGPPE